MSDFDKLHSRPEAAAILHVSVPSVDRLIKAGKLPAVQIGRRKLVTGGALRRLIGSAA